MVKDPKVIVYPKKSRYKKTGYSSLYAEKSIPVKRASARPAYSPNTPVSKFATKVVVAKKPRRFGKLFKKTAAATGRGVLAGSRLGYRAGQKTVAVTKKGFIGGYKANIAHRSRKLAKLEYLAKKEEIRARTAEHKLRRVTAPEALASREREYEVQRNVLGEIQGQKPRKRYGPLSDKGITRKGRGNKPSFFD